MYKDDMTLNKLQGLICQKKKKNPTKPNPYISNIYVYRGIGIK